MIQIKRERETKRELERKRERSWLSKMKYLEGGSTRVAEQGGLKSEAAEVVTRQRATTMKGERVEQRRQSGLDRSPTTSELRAT